MPAYSRPIGLVVQDAILVLELLVSYEGGTGPIICPSTVRSIVNRRFLCRADLKIILVEAQIPSGDRGIPGELVSEIKFRLFVITSVAAHSNSKHPVSQRLR